MAKPLTRVVRHLLNKIGYDLLRLQKTEIHHEARSGLGRGGGFDAFEAVVPRPVSNFDIYLRSCARVDVLLQDRARFIGVPKAELILRCAKSLVNAIHHAQSAGLDTEISLIVVDDHSDADFVEAMSQMLEAADFRTEFVTLQGTGVNASLRETYEMARQRSKGLIYFTADDYLHDVHAVLEIVETYGRLRATLGKDVALFPSDYPDRYRHVEPTHVLLGSNRHWRRIGETTGADIVSVETLKTYWDIYMAFSQYGTSPEITEETTIAKIYSGDVPCFSPLPSLAVHFQHFDTLSPYFDWQHWWEASQIEPPARQADSSENS